MENVEKKLIEHFFLCLMNSTKTVNILSILCFNVFLLHFTLVDKIKSNLC